MRHITFYLVLSLFFIGCNNSKKEEKTESKSKKVETSISEIGKNNFAVVWKWTTTNEQLVSDNSITISNELTSLWKKGVVENTYYNNDSKVDKLSYFPNISFSLKAETLESAKEILNNLTVVKKGIATYNLFPIGTLWLSRKSKTIHEKGMTKSFVTVWKTIDKPTDKLTQSQNDIILELWKSGKIENVYFDIEGTQIANNKTDFVFYANANSLTDAKTICESLPFFKDKIATYKIYEVGVFWMGKYKQN